jgi:hypothetical protein
MASPGFSIRLIITRVCWQNHVYLLCLHSGRLSSARGRQASLMRRLLIKGKLPCRAFPCCPWLQTVPRKHVTRLVCLSAPSSQPTTLRTRFTVSPQKFPNSPNSDDSGALKKIVWRRDSAMHQWAQGPSTTSIAEGCKGVSASRLTTLLPASK